MDGFAALGAELRDLPCAPLLKPGLRPAAGLPPKRCFWGLPFPDCLWFSATSYLRFAALFAKRGAVVAILLLDREAIDGRQVGTQILEAKVTQLEAAELTANLLA